MQAFACWCVLLAAPDAEYAGPAYVTRGGDAVTVGGWCGGEALVLSVRVGLGPEQIERLFGPPLLTSRFRAGPVEWWYPRLGVTVYWPARLFRPARAVERVVGGVE